MGFMCKANGLPILAKPELEYLADEHTKAFSLYDGKESPGFSVWKFAAFYLGKKIYFEWLSHNGTYLGLCSFSDGTVLPIYDPDTHKYYLQEYGADSILLSKTLESQDQAPGRARFTLMHECAHHLLHKDYYKRLKASTSGVNIAYSIQKDQEQAYEKNKTLWKDEDWIEWQANYLASALLMPARRVDRVLEERGYQEDYFQHVLAGSSERVAYQQLISRLATAFKVSMTAAKLRLEAIGFERLPDLQVKKPDPWLAAWQAPPPQRMTKEERRWEKIELGWEKKIARERHR